MTQVDAYIPQPERPIDLPFLMPVEDVFSISGRGTVVTGRIEQGIVKVGEEVEIVGIRDDAEDHLHGRGDVPQAAGPGPGRRQRRRAAARHQARGRRARPGAVQAGLDHPAHQVHGRGLHPDQGRGRPSHAVLHQLPSAVLLPDHRRDRDHQAEGRRGDDHARRQRRAGRRADHPDRHGHRACASPSAKAAAPSAPASWPRSSSDRQRPQRLPRRRGSNDTGRRGNPAAFCLPGTGRAVTLAPNRCSSRRTGAGRMERRRF